MGGRSAGADFLGQLNTLSRAGSVGELSDGQLLERFATARGDAAEAVFAALVERHGPMVLRVCRQVLGDPHEAEDAFQATFLVLVRKAPSIRKADSVASWLHGVALRIAGRARSDAVRRREAERRGAPATATSPAPEQDRAEPWPELFEEVARLPGHYREPVVLCYLEGLSAEAAALRIGCPRGTVLSRLSRARERLRDRLTRRGLGPTGIAVAAGLSPEASAGPLPVRLLEPTVRASLGFAGRRATETASARTRPVSLAEGMLHAMTISRLKSCGAALLACALVLAGVPAFVAQSGGGPGHAQAQEPAPPKPDRADEPRGRLVIMIGGVGAERDTPGFLAVDPNGPTRSKLTLPANARGVRLSPDGRSIAFWQRGADRRFSVEVSDGQATSPAVKVFDGLGTPVGWSRDSKQLYIGTAPQGDPIRYETWRVDVDGTRRTRLAVPEQYQTMDVIPSGDWLLAQVYRPRGDVPFPRSPGNPLRFNRPIAVIRPDGTGERVLASGEDAAEFNPEGFDRSSVYLPRFSPDGRSVVYIRRESDDECSLMVVTVDGKESRRVLGLGSWRAGGASACWSPDARWLAIAWTERDGSGDAARGRLEVVAADGTSRRTIDLPAASSAHVVDWR